MSVCVVVDGLRDVALFAMFTDMLLPDLQLLLAYSLLPNASVTVFAAEGATCNNDCNI
jgi:hypothetical protein